VRSFFARVAATGKEPPQRAVAKAQAAFGKFGLQFSQRHVAPCVEHGEDRISMASDEMAVAVAAQRALHRHRTISRKCAPATDAGDAHLEARRGLPVAQPFLQHCGQPALPQIQR